MAAASEVPGHEKTPALDIDGDPLDPDGQYYLRQANNNFQDCVRVVDEKFESVWPLVVPKPWRDETEFKWHITYDGEDRTKIQIKYAAGNRYLIIIPEPSKKDWEADFVVATPTAEARGGPLHPEKVRYHVYKGIQDNTYWLSTDQTEDGFVASWRKNDVPAGLCCRNAASPNFKSRADALAYWESREQNLSFRFEPTRETAMRKRQNASASADTRRLEAELRAAREREEKQAVECTKHNAELQTLRNMVSASAGADGEDHDCGKVKLENAELKAEIERLKNTRSQTSGRVGLFGINNSIPGLGLGIPGIGKGITKVALGGSIVMPSSTVSTSRKPMDPGLLERYRLSAPPAMPAAKIEHKIVEPARNLPAGFNEALLSPFSSSQEKRARKLAIGGQAVTTNGTASSPDQAGQPEQQSAQEVPAAA